MAQDIIQHHEPFDFESFFEGIKSQYIGLDYHDYSNFLHTAGKKHSFMGSAVGKDRVKVALENAIDYEEAVDIVSHASSVMDYYNPFIRSVRTGYNGGGRLSEQGYFRFPEEL